MTDLARAIGAKVRWRLAAPLVLMMFLSSLDRVNVSFGALHMNHDIGLTPTMYGFGAGIFFIGFLSGQIPSVALLSRIGMPAWMGLCGLIWGACATMMAFLTDPHHYYALRVILGFAEAGLAPGIVFYLSRWTSDRDRAATFAAPMLAIPLSIILGAPVSGWLLSIENPFGMANWRWMFLIEGLPTVLLALGAFFYFPKEPKDARWLNAEERDWLAANSAIGDRAGKEKIGNSFAALRNPLIWATAAIWFFLLAGAYGIIFWLPQVIRQMTGLTDLEIGLVNALPWVGVAIGNLANAWHSDRTQERFWHLAAPAVIAGIAFVLASFSTGILALTLLFIGGLGLGSAQGAFWAVPTKLLTPATMAMGVVSVNIAGSSAGLLVPNLIGIVRESTGSFEMPIFLVAGFLIVAAATLTIVRATSARLFATNPA